MSRRDDIAAGYESVRARIASAAQACGRDAGEITLVVVTKFFPASDIEILAELGVRDVGENRHQEAMTKAAQLGALGLRWHYIGGLQSNKAAAVASYSDVVHSIDRAKLVGGLSRGAQARARDLEVLVQVSLDPPDAIGRAGVDPADLLQLADQVVSTPHLKLRGLMAVAPLGEQPSTAFARLAQIRTGFLAVHPEAIWLSAGMSGDLEEAIAAGATHVRVGGAILGSRPALP
ncbi:MAG: YggS family pyridoxal phosphate-dependent enzyme [Marmoricola sp.]